MRLRETTGRLRAIRRTDQLIWLLISVTVFASQVVISPTGKDSYRLPKDVVFHAGSILVFSAALIAAIFGSLDLRRLVSKEAAIGAAIVLWTTLLFFTSSNRTISAWSLLTVACAVVVSILTQALATSKGIAALLVIIGPAAINACVTLVQVFITGPQEQTGYVATALLGNPDYVGTYLAIPAIVVLGVYMAWRRWYWLALFLLLTTAIFGSRCMSATIAVLVGAGCMLFLQLRRSRIALAILVAVGIIGFVAYTPFRTRLHDFSEAIRTGAYDRVLSGRLLPIAAALAMIRDHPFVGIGPGCFHAAYMPYVLRLQAERAHFVGMQSISFNFGEAHNDHLQVMAEVGIPGYLLFLATVARVASARRTKSAADDPRTFFVRVISIPVVVTIFLLAIAQFPLQLTETIASYAFLVGLLSAWRNPSLS